MVRDPTDERYRKPRRLRNTESQKFIRNVSLAITSLYAIAMYINFRRNILPYANDERYKLNFDEINNKRKKNDENVILKGTRDKLAKIQDTLTKVWKKEATKDNTQTDKV